MIDVKGLQKNYGGLQVLKGVDLTINKGDCVVLVGPSGCGKSTFLRCLNRLEEPDGGHVIFNGKEVTDHDIDHVRQKMGMVFQPVSYTHLGHGLHPRRVQPCGHEKAVRDRLR